MTIPAAAGGTAVVWGINNNGQTNVPPAATNLVAISAGNDHTLALRADGSVVSWGQNSFGQANVPATATNIVQIGPGATHNLALRADGVVIAWGNSVSGATSVPAVATNTGLVTVAGGCNFSTVLRTNGSVFAWGYNGFGVSNPPPAAYNIMRISAGNKSTGSGGHILALRRDGRIISWGENSFGQTNAPVDATNMIAVAAGFQYSLGLRADGSVLAWGANSFGKTTVPPAATNVVAISAGAQHAYALRSDGKLVSWGDSSSGKRTPPAIVTNSTAIAITAGNLHTACLLGDGTPLFVDSLGSLIAYSNRTFTLNALAAGAPPLTYQWQFNGADISGATAGTLTLPNVQSTNAGTYSVVVSNALGVVSGLVANVSVQIAPELPTVVTPPQSQTVYVGTNVDFNVVATGYPAPTYQWQFNNINITGATNSSYTIPYVFTNRTGNYCVVLSNIVGVVTSAVAMLTVSLPDWPVFNAWPTNRGITYGSPLNLSVPALGAGPINYGWTLNGVPIPHVGGSRLTFGAFGVPDSGVYRVYATNASGWSASPEFHLAAVPVVAWGNTSLTNLPVSLTNAVAIAAGALHTLGLRVDGQVVAWGGGITLSGTYPNYTTNNYRVEVVPPDLSNVVAIAVGSLHSLALRADGTVASWGRNTSGETNVPPTATNIIAVAAGGGHSLALRGDGTVLAWGGNASGQTNVALAATNVVAIAAGDNFSVALRSDGKLVTWGSFSGSLTAATNIVSVSARSGYIVAIRRDGSRFTAGSGVPTSTTFGSPFPSSVSSLCFGAVAGSQYTLYLDALANNGISALYYPGGGLSGLDTRFSPPTWLRDIVAVAVGDYSFALVRPSGGLPELQTSQRSAVIGGSAVFTTHVEGRRVFNMATGGKYQWRFNGTDIPSATNFCFVRPIVTAEHAGDYSVVLTDYYYGSSTSQVSMLNVSAPPLPQIATHPQSRSVSAGTNVTFSVALAYGIPGQIRWQFNGIDLPGAMGNSLTIGNVQAEDVGGYRAVITNFSGAITSQVATLTVNERSPVFVSQPQSRGVLAGLETTFYAQAQGTAPIDYQWQLNGVPIAGATNSILTIHTVTPELAGIYQLVATNTLGGATSSPAMLSVTPITAWGGNLISLANVPAEATNVLALAAGASHALALRTDGSVVAWGENSCNMTTVPASASNVVRIAAGESHSLALRDDGTLVHWGYDWSGTGGIPAGLSNVVGMAAGYMHSVAVKADGTITTWGRGFRGETNVPPNLTNVVAVAAGGFQSLALRRDGTLTAWGALDYTPPEATNVTAIAVGHGHGVALRGDGSVVAWGSTSTNSGITASISCGGYSISNGDLTSKTNLIPTPPQATNIVAIASGRYHILALRGDGQLIAWGNNSVGQIAVPTGSGFNQIAAGGDQSLALTGPFAPQLGRIQTNRIAGEGMTVLMNATAGGLPPQTWTWRMNATNVVGSNTAFLHLPNATTNDSASYEYVVANAHGAVTGAVSLTLTSLPPIFLAQPLNTLAGLGTNVTLSASPRGSAPLTYQWRRNGINLIEGGNITGVNAEALTIANAQFSDAGVYSLAVTNPFGFAISSNATLTVFTESALAEALDTTGLVWTTGGPAGWHWQTGTMHDGVDAAETGPFPYLSGQILDQTNWIETSITGPATISFWWRAIGWLTDRFSFSVDGVERMAVVNDFEWQQRSYFVPAGTHVLRWTYECSPFAGPSTAWLDEVTLTNNPIAPVVTTQPTSRTFAEGSSTTFSAAVSGTEPLVYQWQCNGTNLPNATNTTLTLSAIKPDHAGSYQFFATNIAGFATSQVATLTVSASMPTVTLSGSQWLTAAPGMPVTMASTILGSAPLNVQWQRERVDIPGANNSTLTLSNLQAAQAGLYRVVASNGLGTASSADVSLTIVPVASWGVSQPRVPETVGDVVEVAAGTTHSTALRRDGTIMQWGTILNPIGLTPIVYLTGNDVLSTHVGSANHNIGIRNNGTVVVFNYVGNGLGDIPAGLSNVVAVATSGEHDLALRADGTVVAWGANTVGQASVPSNATNLVAIAAGSGFSLGLTDLGTLIGWGTNNYGQLNLPEGDFVAVSASGDHAFALRADGTIAAWGGNGSGQTNVPPRLTNIVAIASGSTHDLALRGDGKVFGWGGNTYGQASVWDTLTNVISIAGGSTHSLAVVGDGRPVVTVPPQRRRLAPGGNATLRVFATGTSPLQYQWQHNGTNIPGATNSTLIVGDAGNYSVIVSNHLGTVTPPGTTVMPGLPTLRFDTAPGAMTLAADGLHLRLLGLSSRGPVVVFASTNFITWTPILTNPPVTGSLTVVDWAATNLTQRFYRAIEMAMSVAPPALRFHSSSWMQTPTGTLFRATLTGLVGSGPVAILGSSNLNDWTVIASNPPVSGEWQFQHLRPDAPTLYWYRAMEQR